MNHGKLKNRVKLFITSLKLQNQDQVLEAIEQNEGDDLPVYFSFPLQKLEILKEIEEKIRQNGLCPRSIALCLGTQKKPYLYTDTKQDFIVLKYSLKISSQKCSSEKFLTNNLKMIEELEKIRKFFSVFSPYELNFFRIFYPRDELSRGLELYLIPGTRSDIFNLVIYDFIIRVFGFLYQKKRMNVILPSLEKILEEILSRIILEFVTR